MWSLAGIPLGILLLIAGGAALVTGASRIAARLGISPLVIGLTIVGFGTSAPELMINLMGAARGETGLAFGNVIGSNIANLALVLGAAALVRAIDIQGDLVRREVPLLLLVTTIVAVMALDGLFEGAGSVISRTDSVVLLLLFGIFLYIAVKDVMQARKKDALLTEMAESPMVTSVSGGRFNELLILMGFVLLFVGGELTVRASVALATQLGISTALVGLFVVAVGTSMPELVTSIVAAVRKESDLALGNVIGSNIFNTLIVLPASGLVSPITVPKGGVSDVVVSWLLAAALIPIFFFGRAHLGRGAGVVLLLVYFGYATYRLTLAA